MDSCGYNVERAYEGTYLHTNQNLLFFLRCSRITTLYLPIHRSVTANDL